MNLLAIDPGNEESALLVYDVDTKLPVIWEKMPNSAARRMFDQYAYTRNCNKLAIEMIASYGMPVGASVFETCVWVGRFIERWEEQPIETRLPANFIYRREVKLHLCNSSKAKDANVRQALIDRYGGKEKAIGKKANPGVLYGMKADCWAALGVAITAAEKKSI